MVRFKTLVAGRLSLQVRRGDLVYDTEVQMTGIILCWQKYGGPGPDVWSIFYEDGTTGVVLDNEIEIINRCKK